MANELEEIDLEVSQCEALDIERMGTCVSSESDRGIRSTGDQ
jgi:hypothetical protein